MTNVPTPNYGRAIGGAFTALFAAAIVLTVLFVVVVLYLGFGRGFFVNESAAVRTLQANGFADIRIVKKHWISPRFIGGCAADDDVAFFAEARNAAGRVVQVTACEAFFWKKGTLRAN